LIWDCQPGPASRSFATTSGSRRTLICSFVVADLGRPRPRRTNVSPSNTSAVAGRSRVGSGASSGSDHSAEPMLFLTSSFNARSAPILPPSDRARNRVRHEWLRARDLNQRRGLPGPIAPAKRLFSAGEFAARCWPEDGLPHHRSEHCVATTGLAVRMGGHRCHTTGNLTLKQMVNLLRWRREWESPYGVRNVLI
jgi:hypothetical protein